METNTINRLIETFEYLSIEDKEYIYEIFKKQIIAEKRKALEERAEEVMCNLENGNMKQGSVEDLYRDLEND